MFKTRKSEVQNSVLLLHFQEIERSMMKGILMHSAEFFIGSVLFCC